MTDYRILLFNPEISAWAEVGTEKASNPKQALRQLNDRDPLGDAAASFLVVPERNWTVLTPELKTQTRLVFK